MKTEFADVNDTRKTLRVEIPSDVVNAQIDRVARDYSRKARVPGFRPGKAPARVIKQRYRDQILHDVAQDMVPRAIDDALRERGVEAIDTPEVRDVVVEESQPLTFTASFDTVPAFEPGESSTITLMRPSSRVEEAAVDEALQRIRERAARYEPVEGRGVVSGDTAVVDYATDSNPPEKRENVTIELGSSANPPGLDQHLLGLDPGAVATFTLHFPADYSVVELADKDVGYTVTVKAIKKRVLPELDDEFAKDLGEFETLAALRARVRADLEHEAGHEADRRVRAELMKQLAARVPFEVPSPLVDREIDRRLDDFAGRLVQQNIDPRTAGIDWRAFRESQHETAREAVAAGLALDEVGRREHLEPTEEEVDREVARYAERSGQAPAVVRARIEKEGGLSRVYAGLRREKSVDFLIARARLSGEV